VSVALKIFILFNDIILTRVSAYEMLWDSLSSEYVSFGNIFYSYFSCCELRTSALHYIENYLFVTSITAVLIFDELIPI
jgi:hypothetical protein